MSIAIGAAICAAGALIFDILDLMNSSGNNKGLNFNIPRKFYLPCYIGINKKEPKGFNNIWEVFSTIKKSVNTIVKLVKLKTLKKLANMYKSAKNSKHRIIVLAKIIYDYYCGAKVYKSKYKML